jgi:hypothetical protein
LGTRLNLEWASYLSGEQEISKTVTVFLYLGLELSQNSNVPYVQSRSIDMLCTNHINRSREREIRHTLNRRRESARRMCRRGSWYRSGDPVDLRQTGETCKLRSWGLERRARASPERSLESWCGGSRGGLQRLRGCA